MVFIFLHFSFLGSGIVSQTSQETGSKTIQQNFSKHPSSLGQPGDNQLWISSSVKHKYLALPRVIGFGLRANRIFSEVWAGFSSLGLIWVITPGASASDLPSKIVFNWCTGSIWENYQKDNFSIWRKSSFTFEDDSFLTWMWFPDLEHFFLIPVPK